MASKTIANDAFEELEEVIMHGTVGVHMLATKQGKYCRGLCARFAQGRPIGKVYETHDLCRSCGNNYGIWILKKDVIVSKLGQRRCPCCNMRVKTKSSKSHHQLTKKPIPLKPKLP